MHRKNLLVSIPHSGTYIPPEIRSRIPHSDDVLRNESDLYTDQIFDVTGAKVVKTEYSRIIADPNRAPDEIYTEGELRALGVTMLSLPEGVNTFEADPTLEEVHDWVQKYHEPYHAEIRAAIKEATFLIDGHSMWSRAAPGHYGTKGDERADIILGNQYFCSCSAETTNFAAEFFAEKGYSVAINDPYPGRYIIGTYCSRIGLPGIQLEINRKLYMNEDTLKPIQENIQRLRDEFDEFVSGFCSWYEGPQKAEDRDVIDLSENV